MHESVAILLRWLAASDGPICVVVLIVVLLRSWRREDCWLELYRREHASNLKQQNETLRIVLKSFERGAQPNLSDLVENSEDEWSLKP